MALAPTQPVHSQHSPWPGLHSTTPHTTLTLNPGQRREIRNVQWINLSSVAGSVFSVIMTDPHLRLGTGRYVQPQHITEINLHLEWLVSCHIGVTSYYISDYLGIVDVSDVRSMTLSS